MINVYRLVCTLYYGFYCSKVVYSCCKTRSVTIDSMIIKKICLRHFILQQDLYRYPLFSTLFSIDKYIIFVIQVLYKNVFENNRICRLNIMQVYRVNVNNNKTVYKRYTYRCNHTEWNNNIIIINEYTNNNNNNGV